MRKMLLTLFSVVALGALVACGGSSNNTPLPPPPSTGNNVGFSNSSLKGSYVFSANGVTPTNTFATVGVFTADGAGNISSGTRDTVNDAGGQTQNEPITGTYTVNQDGRGQVFLNGSSGQVIYRFVMQSPSKAKLFQISNATDAVGRIQLQAAVPAALTGTFIFRLDGENGSKQPYGAIGGLMVVAGTALTGFIDENNNGTFNAQLPTTGSYTSFATVGTGRSTATFTSSTGTHNFIVYFVSPSRIEVVSTDKSFFLHGHADLQTSVASVVGTFTGDQAFKISGASINGAIVQNGRLTLDGLGNLTNAIEDFNQGGVYFNGVTFGGTYAVDIPTTTVNGRWTASLTSTTSTLNLVGWQVSPQKSMLLTNDSSILETGTMRAQTIGLTNASISGNYAENLSGILVGSGNVESGGNFDADGASNLSGTIDSQTATSINTDITQTGNYSVAANGRGFGTIGNVPVRFYTVDANTIYLISTDPNRIYQGMMVKQQLQ